MRWTRKKPKSGDWFVGFALAPVSWLNEDGTTTTVWLERFEWRRTEHSTFEYREHGTRSKPT